MLREEYDAALGKLREYLQHNHECDENCKARECPITALDIIDTAIQIGWEEPALTKAVQLLTETVIAFRASRLGDVPLDAITAYLDNSGIISSPVGEC